MKSEAKQALYVHYLAHNLNLYLKDVTNGCDLIQTVMDFIYNLVQLIRFSPKRLSLFDSLRKEISLQSSDSTCMMSLRMYSTCTVLYFRTTLCTIYYAIIVADHVIY